MCPSVPSEGQSPSHPQPEGLQLTGESVPQDWGRILKGAGNSEMKLKQEQQGWKCQPGGNSRGAPPSHQNLPGLKRSRRAKFNLNLSLLKQKNQQPSSGGRFTSGSSKRNFLQTLCPNNPQRQQENLSKQNPQVLFKNTQNSPVQGKAARQALGAGSEEPARTSKNQLSSGSSQCCSAFPQCPSESTAFTQKGLQENESFPGTSNKSPLQSLKINFKTVSSA